MLPNTKGSAVKDSGKSYKKVNLPWPSINGNQRKRNVISVYMEQVTSFSLAYKNKTKIQIYERI